MSDPLAGLEADERNYLAVVDAASTVASAVIAMPDTALAEAIATGEKALEDPKDAPPEAIEDVRRQVKFLRAFAEFQEQLQQFAAPPEQPPSEALRPPGQVSPGGVVLP